MLSTPLAEEFETHRRYLTAVAYRMLGSHADAEDAVQETWLRIARATPDADDLRAWSTRVVSRICLDQLRSRTRRRENPLDELPDVGRAPDEHDPAVRAESADRVGYALMLVLEQLKRHADARKWGVRLGSTRGLESRDPAPGPANFWFYVPQHDMDRAPVKAR